MMFLVKKVKMCLMQCAMLSLCCYSCNIPNWWSCSTGTHCNDVFVNWTCKYDRQYSLSQLNILFCCLAFKYTYIYSRALHALRHSSCREMISTWTSIHYIVKHVISNVKVIFDDSCDIFFKSMKSYKEYSFRKLNMISTNTFTTKV